MRAEQNVAAVCPPPHGAGYLRSRARASARYLSARWVALAAVLFGFVLLAPVRAEIPWRRSTVSFSVTNEPVNALLKTFAAEQGLVLVNSASAATPVSGDFNGLSPRQFLDAVCDSTELVWFWDGSRLHVSPASEVTTQPAAVEVVTAEQAQAAFAALGFEAGPAGRANVVRGTGNVLTLVGTLTFHELAQAILRTLDNQERERRARLLTDADAAAEAERRKGEQIEVRVFRLKYASASDIQVAGGSTQSTIPGVARALQNIMSEQSAGALSTGVQRFEGPQQLMSLRGQGLAAASGATDRAVEKKMNARAAGAPGSPLKEAPDGDGTRAVIQADPRLNAVIVRDSAARIPLYEKLIQDLDVSSPVIEIAAAIVDIDANNDKSLGVEFLSYGDGKSSTKARIGFEADRTFNQGNGDNSGANPVFVDGANLVRGEGVLSSVLVPVGGYELLTRIRALEQKGAAQLVSSPSVITLENVEANLRQEQNVYVRVAGQEASDLFNVTAGVQLRVTPTLVIEGEVVSFRLVVEVQDGSFTDMSVDGVPSTRQSAINTQAVVPADRTLLIGGYFVEQHNDNARQVPVLGNVPVLGRLFKRTENNHSRAQRYFFITPRLVDVHKESRLNRPAALSEKSPLPAEVMDPARSVNRAHTLAGRSLPAASGP